MQESTKWLVNGQSPGSRARRAERSRPGRANRRHRARAAACRSSSCTAARARAPSTGARSRSGSRRATARSSSTSAATAARPHEGEDFGVVRFGLDTLHVLRALGLERAVLVGFSVGGNTLLALLARDPRPALALVTIGASARGDPARVERDHERPLARLPQGARAPGRERPRVLARAPYPARPRLGPERRSRRRGPAPDHLPGARLSRRPRPGAAGRLRGAPGREGFPTRSSCWCRAPATRSSSTGPSSSWKRSSAFSRELSRNASGRVSPPRGPHDRLRFAATSRLASRMCREPPGCW